MKKKPKIIRSERTPHVDPLPFRRGEEKPGAPVGAYAGKDDPRNSFLSPIGGEDQGEGAARPPRPPHKEKTRRKPILKFIGPNNLASGA